MPPNSLPKAFLPMPDAIFTDPRLAGLYDALNPPAADTRFYLELAGEAPQQVLDVGCGTGQLALALAGRGHRTTGADPARAMLDIARRQPGAAQVAWIEAEAARLEMEERFDLITMTGHVFQVFLSNDEIVAALSNLRHHLAPRGRLAFETRNPAAREWESWTREESREVVELAGIGQVEVHYQVTEVSLPFVTFDTCFRFEDGDQVAAPSRLRFLEQPELESLLTRAGFHDVVWYGDWDRSPLTPDCPEFIVLAR